MQLKFSFWRVLMNKNRIKILLTVFVLTLVSTGAFTQSMMNWQWHAYKIGFQLPTAWRVLENSNTQFRVEGNEAGIALIILPWNDPKLNARDVAMKGFGAIYNTTGLKVNQDRPVNQYLGGMKGHIVFGEGIHQNKRMSIAVLGLIDPNSPVNVFARFTWWTEHPEANKASLLSEQIAKSFVKYK
jgi:hypothetical protein